ncbi:MAG: hypothetical protein ABEJ65_03065 [bacterium]
MIRSGTVLFLILCFAIANPAYGTTSTPSPDQLHDIIVESGFRVLEKTFNTPELNAQRWDRTSSISFSKSLWLGNDRKPLKANQSTPSGKPFLVLSGNVAFDFAGRARIDLSAEKPQLLAIQRIAFRQVNNRSLILFPNSNQYFSRKTKKGLNKLTGMSSNDSTLLNTKLITKKVKQVPFNGANTYRVTYKNPKDRSSLTIYAGTTPPHRIRGFHVKPADNSPYDIRLLYQKKPRFALRKIVSEGSAGTVPQSLTFHYDGSTLRKIVPSREKSYVRIHHGENHSTGASVHVADTGDLYYRAGHVSWTIQNGLLRRLSQKFRTKISGRWYRGQVRLNSIQWREQPLKLNAKPPKGYSKLDQKQLTKKFMPILLQLTASAMKK